MVQWLDDSGDDVTNKTVIHLLEDTHGLYSVFSTLTLQGPVNKTFTFVLKNKDLRQEIRRAITLEVNRQYPGFEKPLTLPLLHKC